MFEVFSELRLENSLLFLGSPEFTSEEPYFDFPALTEYSELY